MFNADPETEAIVLIGEIGGDEEERAAAYCAREVRKPMAAFIAGRTAPPGRRMGHAGAIISGGAGTAESKRQALQAAGIRVADSPSRSPRCCARRASARAGSSSRPSARSSHRTPFSVRGWMNATSPWAPGRGSRSISSASAAASGLEVAGQVVAAQADVVQPLAARRQEAGHAALVVGRLDQLDLRRRPEAGRQEAEADVLARRRRAARRSAPSRRGPDSAAAPRRSSAPRSRRGRSADASRPVLPPDAAAACR